jgi:hypothetical protein
LSVGAKGVLVLLFFKQLESVFTNGIVVYIREILDGCCLTRVTIAHNLPLVSWLLSICLFELLSDFLDVIWEVCGISSEGIPQDHFDPC